jgi:predicted MFS family arabinose efflux permease
MSTIAIGSGIPAVILAHQGGWDEILLVAGPILVIAGLLTLAKRRVTASARRAERTPTDHPTS